MFILCLYPPSPFPCPTNNLEVGLRVMRGGTEVSSRLCLLLDGKFCTTSWKNSPESHSTCLKVTISFLQAAYISCTFNTYFLIWPTPLGYIWQSVNEFVNAWDKAVLPFYQERVPLRCTHGSPQRKRKNVQAKLKYGSSGCKTFMQRIWNI